MNKQLILIEENIFTEDMLTLHDALERSINVLNINNLKSGITEEEYSNIIKDLNNISNALKKLSEKNFNDAKISTTILEL